MAGLVANGLLKIVIQEELVENPKVLGGRFVLIIKHIYFQRWKIVDAGFYFQGHKYSEKQFLVHPSTYIS